MVSENLATRQSTRRRNAVNYDASIELDDDSEVEIVDAIKINKKRIIEDEDLDEEEEEGEDYAPRIARKRSSKRQKTRNGHRTNRSNSKQLVCNIDDVENYTENPIFESLSTQELSPTELAQSWVDDFTTDEMSIKFEALKDFLNFILRCSGCIVQLSRHDVTNTEDAGATVSEIQTLFSRQKYHEFPMMYASVGNNKDWKDFPDNAIGFITQIIVIAAETGILYEDNDEFVELLLEWISSMSTSNIRALRYVSTLFGLSIQSVLCKLSVNTSTFIDKFLRQLKKENDSLKSLVENRKNSNRQLKRQVDSASERIKVIEGNVEMYKRQKKLLDNYIDDFFNTLFVHRYRDVAPEIRLKCVHNLGEWMEDYPEKFFESTYLRYLGWLLTDQDPLIRSEVFKVLVKLYKKRVTVAALRQFTSYFKHKLIQIVIYETDFNARYNCLQLLIEIIEKGYLNDDDIIQLTSLIFIDNEDLIYPNNGSKLNPFKFMKEIAKFISKAEILSVNEIIERDATEFDRVNEILPLDCRKALKIKTLLQNLGDSYEYYQTNYSTSKVKLNVENSKLAKFSNSFQYIYQLKNYNDGNEMYELLLMYINFDFSAFQMSDEMKDTLELNSTHQSYLLNLINGATEIYSQGIENKFYKTLFPHPTRGKPNTSTSLEKDSSYYITKLLAKLPDICYYFHDDIEKISIIINLTINLLKCKTVESNTTGLVDTVKQFLRYYLVINFPLLDVKTKNSTYYDSINFHFVEFLQIINIEEMGLIAQLDSVFTEINVNLNTKIESNSPTIIDSLNKMYILSHCSYISNRVFKEFDSVLPVYMKLMCHMLNEAKDSDVVEEISKSGILSFLHLSNYYINKSLRNVYESKLNHRNDLSYANDTNIRFNTINYIQKNLALLIRIENVDDKTDLFTPNMVHDLSVVYMDNMLTISAFNAEFKSLDNVPDSLGASSPRHNSDGSLIDEHIGNANSLRSNIPQFAYVQLLKMFLVREYQVAELFGSEMQLERDAEEDVNFSIYSVKDDSNIVEDQGNDNEGGEIMLLEHEKNQKSRKENYEILLCELGSKLALCCILGLVDDNNVLERIKKNTGLLGGLYKTVLDAVEILDISDGDKGNGAEKAKTDAVVTKKSASHLLQSKLTKIIKRNNANDEITENHSSEGEGSELEIGEDEDDPIEEGSDNEMVTGGKREEDIEFSDIDDDSVIENSVPRNDHLRESSEISSFASSFPFTQ